MGVVAFVVQEEQAAFFRREQEDQPHHHRQRRLVEFTGRHVTQEFAVAILVGAIEGLDEDFDGPAYLVTEFLGDFVLVLQRALEQLGESLVLRTEESSYAEQRNESPERLRFLPP